ncbi:amidase [Mycobacterium sp.]|uniref:amidase n=1 Tax=Mycobacterium sp. TaxID=1785 RepID=UPI003A8AD2E9
MARIHAFGDDALGDLDAVGVAEALRSGRVAAAEVIEAAIARTEAVNPELNGLAHAGFEQARSTVPGAGFFAGVPAFVKDNVNVAGQPTMFGTDAWDPRPAAADSGITRVLRATGLVPLGKTQLSEFGFNAVAEHPRLGAVRNPWNTGHTAGASSSGSGAFVAAGVVPIAHANDGGGSIRIPASCNGLVGLKPSRGRLPVDPELRRLPVDIVANGVLTRSVRDTAAWYREAERTWCNSALTPIGDVTRPGGRRLRIAVTTRAVARDCAAEVRELTLRTGALLDELGHHVEEVHGALAPVSFENDFVLYWGFLAFAQTAIGRRTFGDTFDRTRLDALTLGLAAHARRNLHRLPLAITRLRRVHRRSERFFGRYDVLLTPTLADVPPPVGYLAPTDYEQVLDRLRGWVAFTPLQNVTGEPALSLPLTQSEAGLPVGMMFTAGLGQEARLLELAYELEEARPWARIQRPG